MEGDSQDQAVTRPTTLKLNPTSTDSLHSDFDAWSPWSVQTSDRIGLSVDQTPPTGGLAALLEV